MNEDFSEEEKILKIQEIKEKQIKEATKILIQKNMENK